MNYKDLIKEKLAKLLFLEIDWEKFKVSVGIPSNIKLKTKDIYIPISSKYVADNAMDSIKVKNLPIYYFIEGMLIALGADKNLSYTEDYIIIFNNLKDSESCGRSLVADSIKKDDLLEAYIILKGLYLATGDEEYLKKQLLVAESIREKDSGFTSILLSDCDEATEEFDDMPEPYLYRAVCYKEKSDIQKAKVEINEYLRLGGETNEEIKVIINDINNLSSYEKAIENIDEDPAKSIGTFLSLLEQFDKNPLLYYYLAVAYRKLDNYEKAIYYLNESLNLESGIAEVINELGINYACLGDYDTALTYFKKVFEASKDVEACTNIIMCYIKLGDKEQARLNLDIAKKLDPTDEIVCDLDRMLAE